VCEGAQRIVWIAAAALALALARPSAAEENPPAKERFSKALAEAKTNLKTLEGREHYRIVVAHLAKRNPELLTACFKSTPSPDASPFEIVYQEGSEGKILEALVWPETNIGLCFRDAFKAELLPPAPRVGYWSELRMSFAP
jgi:hypothetical protein